MGVNDRTEPIVHEIQFIDGDGKLSETMVIVHQSCAQRPVKHFRNRRRAS